MIAGFKIYLAPNGGYAEAVPVVSDPVHYAVEQVLCFLLIKVAKTK
jgi:hypothetical protein